MVLFQSFSKILDPIFAPLLRLPSLWAIIIISLFVSVIMTLVYKVFTDQNLMKILKGEMKEMQKEVKAFSHDPAKALEIQKRMMEKNMQYMTHSFKPTLVTFIPIILIFGWLSTHFAFLPILPGQEFSTSIDLTEGTLGQIELIVPEGLTLISGKIVNIENSKAVWTLKGIQGKYDLTYKYKDRTYLKPIIVTEKQEYIEPIKSVKDEHIKTISVNNQELKPLNLFGWEIGWLGTYILISIVSSMSLRKILRIH